MLQLSSEDGTEDVDDVNGDFCWEASKNSVVVDEECHFSCCKQALRYKFQVRCPLHLPS
jgi:hypothetical protein